jgi:hypothetical protein
MIKRPRSAYPCNQTHVGKSLRPPQAATQVRCAATRAVSYGRTNCIRFETLFVCFLTLGVPRRCSYLTQILEISLTSASDLPQLPDFAPLIRASSTPPVTLCNSDRCGSPMARQLDRPYFDSVTRLAACFDILNVIIRGRHGKHGQRSVHTRYRRTRVSG